MNRDGKVDSTDYELIRKYLLGISSDSKLDAADLNGDGTVTTTDIVLLKRDFIYGGHWLGINR